MLQVPLIPKPSQTVQIVLDGQNCQISVSLRGSYLFADVAIDSVDIVSSVVCRERAFLICTNTIKFKGNLIFVDTRGNSDPQYDELGSRWVLVYLNEAEYDLIR